MEFIKNSILGTFHPSTTNAVSISQNFSPHLIEPNIKYVIYSTLQKCHNHRVKIYNWLFNFCIFSFFVFLFGGSLYYCYKSKPTPQELHERMIRDQKYILSKIRFYQNEKLKERSIQRERTSEITDLPTMTNPNRR